LESALEIAERIAAQAPMGVRATLASARVGTERGEVEAAARVAEDMPAIRASEDFQEGVASFRERRAAKFAGR
jgi:enoyl-CoA hydratase/carnithine racemase